MYAMTGKMNSQPGKRLDLVNILTRAAALVGGLPGSRMYVVSEDLSNETAIWVFEMWDDKKSHDDSLANEQALALIAEARPLLDGAPEGAELRVIGGYGV